MARRRSNLGRLIERGLEEAIAYERGKLPGARLSMHPITAREASAAPPQDYPPERVRLVRSRMGLSQAVFAKALNVSDSTVRAWEQGKRSPDGPSLRLLELAEREPGSLLRTLIAASNVESRGSTARRAVRVRPE